MNIAYSPIEVEQDSRISIKISCRRGVGDVNVEVLRCPYG